MTDLVEIKKRITNINSIIEISDAMQIITMISLGKINKLLHYRHKIQPYYDRLLLSRKMKLVKSTKKSLLLVFTSQKGLCASFNQQLLPLLQRYHKNHHVVLIGAKGKELLEKNNIPYEYYFDAPKKIFNETITVELSKMIEKKNYPKDIKVILNQYGNMFTQKPSYFDFFPIEQNVYRNVEAIVDVDIETLDQIILKKYVKARLYYLFLQNFAGEIANKFILMRNAVENGNLLKEELTRQLYKSRQMLITQELTEIITSYKVLQKGKKR